MVPLALRPFAIAVALAAALATAPGQEAAPDFPTVRRWLDQWSVDREGSRKDLDDAVKELLVKPEAGFDWLAKKLGEATAAQRKGVELVVTNAVIEYLRRKHQRGITFAGQYEPLRRLQPFVGELLFGLVLDTPQWFPHTHRVRLVRPLRDLYPRAPSEARLAEVVALADSSIEPDELRSALSCMLWQWGTRQPAQARLDALRRESGEGEVEDRLRTMLRLAELQYELLDYGAAAATHRSVHALAESSKVPLRPIDLYAAACVFALTGDVERGLATLRKCASIQSAPDTDAALKLARSLWDDDPEIDVLRRDPRYAAIHEQAFGPADTSTETPRR